MNRLNYLLRCCFGAFLCLGVFVLQGWAATRSVDTTVDDASMSQCTNALFMPDCSLRGAIAGAQAGDTIDFASPLFDSPQSITIQSVDLYINKNLTIIGRGARLLTVERLASNPISFRIFTIAGGATVSISGMTVTGGTADLSGQGGGIYNIAGTVTLDRMRFTGNTAFTGGGICNDDTMTITNTLVDGNIATALSAGIHNRGIMSIANTTVHDNEVTAERVDFNAGVGITNEPKFSNNQYIDGTLNLNNVTITGNKNNSSSQGSSGGISNFTFCNMRNTLIAANSVTAGTSPDVRGNFTSNGNNLIRDTTGSTGFSTANGDIINVVGGGLAALQNNGGDTDTRLPTMTSLAVNAGNNCVVDLSCGANNPPLALIYDQRGAGFPRRNGTAVDIGAAEAQFVPTAAGTTAGGRVTESNGRGIFRALVTMTDASGNQRQAYTNQLGYYNFEDVASGQTYIFTARHRRYLFDQPTQVQFIGEEQDGINFTGTSFGIFRFDPWNLPTKGIE